MSARVPLPSADAPPPRLASVHRLPLDGMDDAALARAIAAGDEAAAALAWRRYAPVVRSVLRRTIGPYEDVEDLVQEVFLRYFRQRGELRDPSALRSFLIGVAMHVAVSELRRRRVRRWLRLTSTGVLPEVSGAPLGQEDEAREAMRRLYAVLDRLDDASRLTFVLRYVEGLELVEIASALDVSLATTKRRLAKVTARVLSMVERDPVLPGFARAMLRARSGEQTEERP
jgi:RNA polymerase sigma-70 factor (ECF subfamily)